MTLAKMATSKGKVLVCLVFFLETLETNFEGELPGALGIRVYNKDGMHSRV